MAHGRGMRKSIPVVDRSPTKNQIGFVNQRNYHGTRYGTKQAWFGSFRNEMSLLGQLSHLYKDTLRSEDEADERLIRELVLAT